MTQLFEQRVDASVEFLDDWFNHQRDDAPPTKPELKEILTTCLELLKEDHDAKKPLIRRPDLL